MTKGPPAGPERTGRLLETEFVVKPASAKKHKTLLEALNAGASKTTLRHLLA